MHLILSVIGQVQEAAAPTAGIYIYGPMGIICGWFMLRGEKFMGRIADKVDTLAHRIDGLTRAILVDVVSREHAGTQTRALAQEMLTKAEARQGKVGD